MRTPSKRTDRGHTLVEISTVLVVFTIGMMGALAVLTRGTHFSGRATTAVVTESRARLALGGLLDVVEESSVKYVDTNWRYHNPSTGYDLNADRFGVPNPGLKQCSSPVCRFHTRPDLTFFEKRYVCGYQFRSGMGYAPYVRGKNWPTSLTNCPLDGSTLISSVMMDGLKLFVARGADGTFSTDGGSNPAPDWNGLVLFFPYAEPGQMPELRRYEVHISDLMAAAPTYSAGWSRFDPLAPTMVDLFDFGTDGTLNGVPDGQVPLTVETSDASYEVFAGGFQGSEPVVVISKTLGSMSTPPYRDLDLVVRLRDGQTYFSVSHHDTSTTFWSTAVSFVRPPRTLVQNLTEFAVSTAVSDPYDATTNPTGVQDSQVVRISIGTSGEVRAKGGTEWVHEVDTFILTPRN